MDSWTQVKDALDAIGKDKKWLAGQLGIEKIQSVDHWANRGVPHKFRSELDVVLKKQQNQPLAPVQQAQAAINGVASLDVTLNNLSAYLAQVEPGRRESVATLMASLVRTPDDDGLRAALTALLTPSGFVETQRKAA